MLNRFKMFFLVMTAGALFGHAAMAANPVVELKTSMGTITVELFEKEAPQSVKNFLSYVNKGAYNGTIFHRVISGFMIQGGGFNQKMEQQPTDSPITNEAANGLKNTVGTLAMARTNDPHSATSQFFINVKGNDFLDYPGRDGWGYAVFGKVIKGMDIVQAIEKVKTTTQGMYQDVPVEPVVIESAKVIAAPADAAAGK